MIYLTYRVDVRNLVRNKLYICRDYHIQPSEIEKLPYYEYEYMLEDINQIQKEQEEEQKKQQEQTDNMYVNMNPSRMMSDISSQMKMPSMSNFNMSMPKINLPKI